MSSHLDPLFKFITLNIAGLPLPRHAHARARAFCRAALELDTKVINLQEVHTYALLKTLKDGLGGYQVSFKPGIFGPRAGLVTFSRLPLAATSFFSFLPAVRKLPRSERPAGTILETLHKGVLVSQIQNGPVVMNAHLNPNKDGDWSESNRFYSVHKAQLAALAGFTSRGEWRKAPVILSGDFNLAKESQLLDAFIEEGEWTDPLARNFTPTFHEAYLPPGRVPRCIDFVLVRDAAQKTSVQKAGVVFEQQLPLSNDKTEYISDHKGLYAEISLVI